MRKILLLTAFLCAALADSVVIEEYDNGRRSQTSVNTGGGVTIIKNGASGRTSEQVSGFVAGDGMMSVTQTHNFKTHEKYKHKNGKISNNHSTTSGVVVKSK